MLGLGAYTAVGAWDEERGGVRLRREAESLGFRIPAQCIYATFDFAQSTPLSTVLTRKALPTRTLIHRAFWGIFGATLCSGEPQHEQHVRTWNTPTVEFTVCMLT